jgi:hypothetical protein
MTAVASNGHASAAAARDATISDVKEGIDQLNAAVQNFCASNDDIGDVADKAQRQQIIEAAQKVLNAVKRPDDVWVDGKLIESPSELSEAYYRRANHSGERRTANSFEVNMDIARLAACQLLFKWGAFEAIPVEGSISYPDLAVATKAEEALLSKFKIDTLILAMVCS